MIHRLFMDDVYIDELDETMLNRREVCLEIKMKLGRVYSSWGTFARNGGCAFASGFVRT